LRGQIRGFHDFPALASSLLPAHLAFLPDLYRPNPFPSLLISHSPSLLPSLLLLLSRCFQLVVLSASHLLMLVPRSQIFLLRRQRSYVPLKCQLK
jgi:hypothetical protein